MVWGGQSSSDMSGITLPPSLPPPLLNNILNFKVIFLPPLITSPSPQRRIDRNQCRVSLVFMIKMKSIMFACSQLSLHHIVFGCLYVLLAKNINLVQLATRPEYRVVVVPVLVIISQVSPYTNQGPPGLTVNLCLEAM